MNGNNNEEYRKDKKRAFLGESYRVEMSCVAYLNRENSMQSGAWSEG